MRVLFFILASVAVVQAQEKGARRVLVIGPASTECLNAADKECFETLSKGASSYLADEGWKDEADSSGGFLFNHGIRGRRQLITCSLCKAIYGIWFCIFQNICNRRLEVEDSEDEGCWEDVVTSEARGFVEDVESTLSSKFTSVSQLESYESMDYIVQEYAC